MQDFYTCSLSSNKRCWPRKKEMMGIAQCVQGPLLYFSSFEKVNCL